MDDNTPDFGIPVRLEPGGIYVIECSMTLSASQTERLASQLHASGERLGVKFMLLEHGLKIVRWKESLLQGGEGCGR